MQTTKIPTQTRITRPVQVAEPTIENIDRIAALFRIEGRNGIWNKGTVIDEAVKSLIKSLPAKSKAIFKETESN